MASSGSSTAGDRALRLSGMISAAILTLAGLWAASGVMTPVVFALFIIALVWPLQRRLQAILPQAEALAGAGLTGRLVGLGPAGWWGWGRPAGWWG